MSYTGDGGNGDGGYDSNNDGGNDGGGTYEATGYDAGDAGGTYENGEPQQVEQQQQQYQSEQQYQGEEQYQGEQSYQAVPQPAETFGGMSAAPEEQQETDAAPSELPSSGNYGVADYGPPGNSGTMPKAGTVDRRVSMWRESISAGGVDIAMASPASQQLHQKLTAVANSGGLSSPPRTTAMGALDGEGDPTLDPPYLTTPDFNDGMSKGNTLNKSKSPAPSTKGGKDLEADKKPEKKKAPTNKGLWKLRLRMTFYTIVLIVSLLFTIIAIATPYWWNIKYPQTITTVSVDSNNATSSNSVTEDLSIHLALISICIDVTLPTSLNSISTISSFTATKYSLNSQCVTFETLYCGPNGPLVSGQIVLTGTSNSTDGSRTSRDISDQWCKAYTAAKYIMMAVIAFGILVLLVWLWALLGFLYSRVWVAQCLVGFIIAKAALEVIVSILEVLAFFLFFKPFYFLSGDETTLGYSAYLVFSAVVMDCGWAYWLLKLIHYRRRGFSFY